MKLQIDGPDGKTYEIEGDGDAETLAKNFTAQMWPNIASDKELRGLWNTARLAAADAAKGVVEAGEGIKGIVGPPPVKMKGGPKGSFGDAISRWQGAGLDKVFNTVGVPIDSDVEAKRLGVPLTETRRDIGAFARAAAPAALTGAGPFWSAMSGAGAAVGNRIDGETGAVIGSMIAPLTALGASRAMAPKAPPAMTLDEIKNARKAAFATADQGGAVVSQGSLGRMLQDMYGEMAPKFFAKDTHPQAFKAFQELVDEVNKGNVDLGRLFKMRGRMGVLQGGPGMRNLDGTLTQDADMIGTMRRVLDRNITAMQPGRDIIAGDARAINAFREGNALFRREKGLKRIEKAVEDARTNAPTYTAAGFDTALRNEFKKLVKNERQMRFFTTEERDALKKVARGGPVANTFRQLGRLAPQNILYTLLSANVHPGIAALSIPGLGARLTATGLTKHNLARAKDVVAGRPAAPPRPMTPFEQRAIRALFSGGVR